MLLAEITGVESLAVAARLVTAGDAFASSAIAVVESFFAPLAAVGFMKESVELAVARRAFTGEAASGLALDSLMLSVAVEVFVGDAVLVVSRETSLFDRL